MKQLCMTVLTLFAASALCAQSHSVYTQRPDDAKAVYLELAATSQDDSAALQAAIDKVQATSGQGIVFIREGHYRITRTIYVWPSIRLIGYGAHRPVFTLPANTPGFQKDLGYMLFFAGGRPSQRHRGPAPTEPFPGTVPPLTDVSDANPGTFYSAISNIDFAIGDGNPAAVGIRFHAAQHCFMTHMDFHIGSGLAAAKDVGNEAEDLHFYGGQFGIITSKPSPGWQFTLLDSSFEGQREAAISEHEAGLTLVHDSFRNVPAAVVIDPGFAEELWIQHSRFDNISGPAIVISNEHNARTQISVDDLLCNKVPILAKFRESGDLVKAPAQTYQVKSFSHGLEVALGSDGEIRTHTDLAPLTALPAELPSIIRRIPDSTTWTNVQTLGAKGDGVTDDTGALEAAIRTHRTLYLPSGHYLVSRSIALKPDTILIGLHPSTTQIDLANHSKAFDGPDGPVPMLSTPAGGTNIVAGIGLNAGGANSRAASAMWSAGEDSLMDDVRFLGGHGTIQPDGTHANPYNNDHSADPDATHRWDAQYPSLWVLNGGGGTFANIWTPDTFSQAGMYVSNTDTPGHVYELSSEHHVRNEVKLSHVSNWELIALQTEEEHGEGPDALPLELDHTRHILIANMHSYRVVGMLRTYPCAIRTAHSDDVTFRNLHVDSDSKVSFNDSVCDDESDRDSTQGTRFRELGTLHVDASHSLSSPASATVVERLATGFYNISGATVDAQGRLYFIDARWQKIYRYTPSTGIELLRDSPIDAANLAIDRAGNLLVVSYTGDGTVYSFKPDSPQNELTVLKPQASVPRPSLDAWLPVDYWALRRFVLDPQSLQRPFQYLSEDGSSFLATGSDFVHGDLYYGTKMSDVLRTFALAKATPGKPFYVTDEEEQKTYSADVTPEGSLSHLKLFAERGGESVTTGPDGKVYIAAGQVFVYSPDGKQVATIPVSERPIDLTFGGPDGHTLYILARTSLYATRP